MLFEKKEYKDRLRKVKAAMQKQDIDLDCMSKSEFDQLHDNFVIYSSVYFKLLHIEKRKLIVLCRIKRVTIAK